MGDVADKLGAAVVLTVEGYGGIEAIVADQELLDDDRARFVVAAVCDGWTSLEENSRETSARFLVAAATSANPFLMGEAIDILLGAEHVLPTVAQSLVAAFQDVALTNSIRAEIGLEGWVRLSAGGWSRGLLVRGALDEYVTELISKEKEASPYLIRALGAALDMWGDPDLENAMRQLAETREEADAAVELGLRSLAFAVSAEDVGAATAALTEAQTWFDAALSWEKDREDAHAFGTAVRLLHAFAAGRVITATDVQELHMRVVDYLTGFVGTVPHWRQPRAETSARWLTLISELEELRDLDDAPWLNTGAVIAAAGRVLRASRSLQVVMRNEASAVGNDGLIGLVQPRLTAGFASVADITRQLDKWLSAATDPALIEEVTAFRDQLRGGERPKSLGGSDRPPPAGPVGISDRVRDTLALDGVTLHRVQELLNTYTDLEWILEGIAEKVAGLSVEEERQVRDIVTRIEEIVGPIDKVRVAVYAILTVLVRFVSTFLNVSQSGETRAKWLGPDGHAELEATFSNELRNWFRSNGKTTLREVPDDAGGRSDLHLIVGTHQFVIESKRVLVARTFDELVAAFGTQALQYQVSHAPIAFLAVVDYARRAVRTDLTGSFDVRAAFLPESTRTYALTTLRVQANVDPPSASSR